MQVKDQQTKRRQMNKISKNAFKVKSMTQNMKAENKQQ